LAGFGAGVVGWSRLPEGCAWETEWGMGRKSMSEDCARKMKDIDLVDFWVITDYV